MSQVDLPAVARRRVRLALRSARESKQLTQTDIARAMDWSLSKVMRIEKGEVNVSPSDLKLLLQHLDVRDPAQVNQLLDDAKLSRQQRWSIDQSDRDHLTPAMLELFQLETKAVSIRCFSSLIVPGPLQTRAYAEAIVGADFLVRLDPETIEARIGARLRRVQLLYRDPPPVYRVVLDESALLRPIGGADVMADQLDHLMRLMDETPLDVRVVPFAASPPLVAFFGPFVLDDLESGGALLYRESLNRDEMVTQPSEIVRHHDAFELMWTSASDRGTSRKMIAAKAEDWRRGTSA